MLIFFVASIYMLNAKSNEKIIWKIPRNEVFVGMEYLSPNNLFAVTAVDSKANGDKYKTYNLRLLDTKGNEINSITVKYNFLMYSGASNTGKLAALMCRKDEDWIPLIVNFKTNKALELQKDCFFQPGVYGNATPFSPSGNEAFVSHRKGSDLSIVNTSDASVIRNVKSPNKYKRSHYRWNNDKLSWYDINQKKIIVENAANNNQTFKEDLAKGDALVLSIDAKTAAIYDNGKQGNAIVKLYNTNNWENIANIEVKMNGKDSIQTFKWANNNKDFIIGIGNEELITPNYLYVGNISGELQKITLVDWDVIGAESCIAISNSNEIYLLAFDPNNSKSQVIIKKAVE